MPSPVSALRRYVSEVQRWLRGEGPATHLPQRAAAHPVPVHVATLTSQGVELAGELAAIMPFLWSAPRVAQSKAWAAKAGEGGRTKAARDHPRAAHLHRQRCERSALLLGRSWLVHDPAVFQRLFRAAGFAAEAAKAEQGAGTASLSDRLLDAVCLIGPVARCREQLGTFRASGLDLPILVAPSASMERERSSRRPPLRRAPPEELRPVDCRAQARARD